jgi:hypothetical protein
MRVASYVRNGYGRSKRAAIAEAEGKLPASRIKLNKNERAIFDLARLLGVVVPDEWHHTGKYANETDYWSVSRVRGFLRTHKKPTDVFAALARREARRARAAARSSRSRLERLRERAVAEVNSCLREIRWLATVACTRRHFSLRAEVAARRLDQIHIAAARLTGGVFYNRAVLRRLRGIAFRLFSRI